MRGYLALLRPVNCTIAALAILIGAVVAVGVGSIGGSALQVALALLAGFAFTGAGNAMNDYFDRESDAVNHPSRPIPSGKMLPQDALGFAVALFILSLVVGLFVGLLAFAVVVLNLAAMISYELRFKSEGASGNVVISWLVASLFVFGGAAAYGSTPQSLERIAWLGILAFLATLGREIVKDVEDVAGDSDRRTLPMTLGPRMAGFAASTAFITAVALSPFPFATHVLGPPYLGLVLLADGIFIYSAWFSSAKPNHASKAAKYGMVIALIAFLAGGTL